MKTNSKQTLIIKTAISCIARYGIEGSSADVIARKLKIAQSGIFYYFPKQESLFDSLVGYIAQVNHALVSAHLEDVKAKTAKERLFAHLSGNLLWANKYPDQVAVLLLSIAKTGRSRSMKKRVQKLFAVGEERILSLLAEGIARDEFQDAQDPAELAAWIHKALTGMIISFYYSRPERGVEFFNKLLIQNVQARL